MEQTRIVGTAPNGPLGKALTRAIQQAGGEVVEEADSASVLEIGRERFDRRVSSVGADRKATEYEVNYAVEFQLTGPDGEVIVPRQTVDATRDYTFDADAVLSKSDEEEVLRSEMLTFVVQQVFRRLHAQALNQRTKVSDEPGR